MDRSSKLVLRKVIVEFLCLFIVGLCVLMFFLFGKPYKRGFFCNDESLHYPYKSSTVTSAMLYATGLVLPICTMLAGEYLHLRQSNGDSSRVLFGYNIPGWVSSAYEKLCRRIVSEISFAFKCTQVHYISLKQAEMLLLEGIGIFGFGAASTVLVTDIAKYTIGRLRPHFMRLCQPNVNCDLPENQYKYFENFTCTAGNVSTKLLKEVRLSFPSGHSSFSAYTMIYLAMYLQLRVTWKGSKLLKCMLQLTCLLMAWFTAMSRVSDYKHHWSDVLAGSTLGTIVALIVGNCVADLFGDRRRYSSEEKHRSTDYDTEGGTQDESTPLRTVMPSYNGHRNNPEDTN